MRLKLLLPCLTVALLAAAGMTIWSGCDTGSATEDIVITPSDVTLSKGQSQIFTVSGGYEYKWTLDPDNGTASLSPRSGDTVTFTLLAFSSSSSNGSSGVKVGCTSFIPGTAKPNNSTNSTSNGGYTASAIANVHILNGLAISPGSATIAPGGTLGLVASGGSDSYVWSVNQNGTLSGLSGASVTFTAGSTTNGSATITVTDSDGLQATCVVTIKGSGTSALTVAASQTTFPGATGTAALSAVGGSGTYSWSIQRNTGAPVGANISPTTGSPVIFNAPGAAFNWTVKVTDSAGAIASVTLSGP